MRAEEIGVSGRYFDSQAFSPSAANVQGLKLSALYTLQDRLARDAKQVSGFEHRDVTFGQVLHEARTQFIVESDAPRRTRRDLLSGDEAIIEPAMQGRGCHAERLRGAVYRHALRIIVRLLRGHEAGDVQCVRRLLTRLAVNDRPVAVLRPWRLRMPAMTASE